MNIDVRTLVGNSKLFKSGNSATLELIGKHGIRVRYASKPTDEEQKEAEDWCMQLLCKLENCKPDQIEMHTLVAGKFNKESMQKESDGYQAFLKET